MSFLRKQETRLVPAKAGNQKYEKLLSKFVWIPASAGMTSGMTFGKAGTSLDSYFRRNEFVKQVLIFTTK